MSDTMKINLLIDGEYYTMNIKRDDELLYRDAAKQLNNKLAKYRKNYPEFDSEKHLIMVAFDLSFESIRLKDRNDTQPYADRIKVLDELVDKCIK